MSRKIQYLPSLLQTHEATQLRGRARGLDVPYWNGQEHAANNGIVFD